MSKAPKFDFNANYLTLYTEVLMGKLQRIEDTQPAVNINRATGQRISNQTLLLGFIFQQLIGCENEREAYAYYKAHKEEVDEKYMVDRLIRKITIKKKLADVIKPSKRFQLALYMYYHDDYDLEELTEFVFGVKKSSKIKGFEKISAIIEEIRAEEGEDIL